MRAAAGAAASSPSRLIVAADGPKAPMVAVIAVAGLSRSLATASCWDAIDVPQPGTGSAVVVFSDAGSTCPSLLSSGVNARPTQVIRAWFPPVCSSAHSFGDSSVDAISTCEAAISATGTAIISQTNQLRPRSRRTSRRAIRRASRQPVHQERTRPREWPMGTSRALRATPTVLMPALGRVESPRRPPRGRRAGTPRGRPRRRGGVRA